ncbi:MULTISPECIES: hypothetical protein [Shewanella]|uniref:Apea-like HEPN domain-containing protein n=1 Tax=Shewanella indica TaxID=768528 RepID=A0ABU4QFF1_9GAMM|nr:MULTISPECIES: hypothetical protein [Shewanella]MDX6017728.1 hypothetical protein [Shewanella indica]NDO73042.1 hypothetical protein [Shewanella sp. SE1]
MEKTKLTSTITVKKYRQLKEQRDTHALADMLYERFSERYIEPFRNHEFKHGFSMMASSCLMIESLYCFQRGRKKTGQAGVEVFEEFFEKSTHLKDFIGYGESFYKNIRCGILHQGETYGGWKIRRKGPLFKKTDMVVNATKFLDALDDELNEFTDLLKKSRFHRKPWSGVIRKFDSICDNCNA